MSKHTNNKDIDNNTEKDFLNMSLILKGAAMGIAEVIPGVSGGTIAFITGIYERLLLAIKSLNPQLIGVFKKEGLQGLSKAIQFPFLFTLGIGMIGGIVVGIFGITYLLEEYPVLLWSFFFGLIIASAIYIGRQIKKWTALEIVLLIVGAIIAYGITVLSPAEGTDALWMVFVSGAIAISALILPGISGSFMLLLMGMYTIIIPNIKLALKLEMDSLIIAFVFGLGCLTGLFSFANVLSWTFKNFRFPTLALLTGFMIGSLNKIWPWRIPTQWVAPDGSFITDKAVAMSIEKIKLIQEINVLPGAYTEGSPYTIFAIVLMVVGFVAVFALDRSSKA